LCLVKIFTNVGIYPPSVVHSEVLYSYTLHHL
jgi:hypothetical protein